MNAIGSAAKQGQARQPRASKLCQRSRRLSQDLTPAHAEDHHRQLPTELGPERLSSLSTTRAENKEKHMYYAITTTFAALTVFVPTFIGMRDRTNANWRSR